MSLQFRSRIKPALDYSEVLNSYGYCCNRNSPQFPVPKSFLECFNEGGHFVPATEGQQPVCPDPDTELGCCCACSYVNSGDLDLVSKYNPNGTQYLTSGIRSNVDKCTCNLLNGKWSSGPCPQSLTNDNLASLCVENNKDVRTPGSCCHLTFDTITGWPSVVTCTNVCNSIACSLLSTDVYPSVFQGATTCSQAECNTNTVVTSLSLTDPGFNVGSCFELINVGENYEYNCKLSRRSQCEGYWVEQQSEDSNMYCDIAIQPTAPTKVNGFYDVQRMGLTTFEALGLTSGDTFQGGIYIGIFSSPLNGQSSEVLGDISFGTPQLARFVNDNVSTSQDKQWALIVDEMMYYIPFLNPTEENLSFKTSLFDGYYNTYGDNNNFRGIDTALTNTFRYTPRNGFIDYYIPSIHELNFYAKYLQRKGITNRGILISSSYFDSKYMGSSVSSNTFNGSSFVYAQAIKSDFDVNYKNILTNVKSIQNLILFRRIVLT